ncbi:MAG: C1 family peptidase [Acidobacteria bacterium]|nr:C1 family peptidase [Acidobacteriota bacterium]
MATTSTTKGRTAKKAAKKVATRKRPLHQLDQFKFDALPDRIDIRDWFYQPNLKALPETLVNCDKVPKILNQGEDGACTGFALAAVINFQLQAQQRRRLVSPWMLYEMARRYDEWPGVKYEGSSARGAMKGWVTLGVCAEARWDPRKKGTTSFDRKLAREALQTPGGTYYRVMHKRIRDMHAALAEAGILYVTLLVHEGWAAPGPKVVKVPCRTKGKQKKIMALPIIKQKGEAENGHAVAIVGYTKEGFIIQNSWGESWGNKGFALLPYEDYLMHATDVWVAQIGVPVTTDKVAEEVAFSSMDIASASKRILLNEIRPYVVDVSNNGELSSTGDYWTTEEDLKLLFGKEMKETTKGWDKHRIMLYLHGGLNSEEGVAKRILCFRQAFLKNHIYPLHIMWETDWRMVLDDIFKDIFTDVDDRAGGVKELFSNLHDVVAEARDKIFERTVAKPGNVLWGEMKENARLASRHPDNKGAMQLIVKYAAETLKNLPQAEKDKLEVHIVGHSAGSIFAAFAMEHLINLGVNLKSVSFMAPAISIKTFKQAMLPFIQNNQCPLPTLFVLSDKAERDDRVTRAYGKSLLYLVSNAFEEERAMPLLGMERFVSERGTAGDKYADQEISALYQNEVNGLPALVVAGESNQSGSQSHSNTHGGFDNDADTLNSILYRILGREPERKFTAAELRY